MPGAGYSGTPLPKKLEIREGTRVATVGAPADFAKTLGPLPAGAAIGKGLQCPRDVTIWFVTSRRQLEGDLRRVVPARGEGSLWVAWPKGVRREDRRHRGRAARRDPPARARRPESLRDRCDVVRPAVLLAPRAGLSHPSFSASLGDVELAMRGAADKLERSIEREHARPAARPLRGWRRWRRGFVMNERACDSRQPISWLRRVEALPARWPSCRSSCGAGPRG
jgi:hypothetical protein